MLEPKQEYTLAKSWREEEDTEAAHQLVTSHLRLVAKIAMGYRGYGLPLAELISEGNVGMMQAPILPEALAQPPAMKDAPCSCLTRMLRILESYRLSYTGRICAPGMPKMYSMPRRSIYLTINSLTFIFML
jgi:hypothetical protein